MIAPLLLALAPCLQDEPLDVPTPTEIHNYVDLMLVELAEGKVDLITEVTQLDEDRGAIFWNLYQDYEIELYRLGDRRLALMEEFRQALEEGGLDDALASDLAARFFVLKKDRAELIERFHGRMSEELSPIVAAQFVQLESRFNVVIDLLFAVDTPLISSYRLTALRDVDVIDEEAPAAEASEETAGRSPALWPAVALAVLSAFALVRRLGPSDPGAQALPAAVCLALSVVICVLLW